MFDLSFTEMVVIGILALIVLGPDKLPQTMRTLGRYYAKFRRTISTLQAQMESELDLAETRQKMQEELAKIKQAEADMQQQMAKMRQSMHTFTKQPQDDLSDLTDSAPNATAAIIDNPSDNSYRVNKQPIDKQTANTQLVDEQAYATISDGIHKEHNYHEKEYYDDMNVTYPWKYMWFKLGAYDKKRRLPPAPLMPNFEPDPLLNTPDNTRSSTHAPYITTHNDAPNHEDDKGI